MTDLSHEQEHDLKIAHGLADAGVPIFSAYRNSSTPGTFLYPNGWQETRAGQQSHNWINRWRPGMALCMVTGVVVDVLDVDPRNGGLHGLQELADADAIPMILGRASTPSDGQHYLIARTHLAKGKPAIGIDLQAGADDGTGRGFVFLAPTVRPSRYGPRKGQDVAYVWDIDPVLDGDAYGRAVADPALARLVDLIQVARAPRRPILSGVALDTDDDDPFDSATSVWSEDEANRIILAQLEAVAAAREGEINNTLGGAARVLGRFVAGGWLDEETAVSSLLAALERGGVHDDRWNVANSKGWTAKTVIGAGLANGAKEPWTVQVAAPVSGPTAAQPIIPGAGPVTPGSPQQLEAPGPPSPMFPRLEITGAADMAYWLQSQLGAATLSGFFLRGGQVVHTPLVNDLGYVEPKDEADDNGPAQIQRVSPGELAAKIQYAHACYKVVKVKDEPDREVPALFPLEAAKRAVDAPEAMGMLRTLRGITHTPMVRSDGTVLDRPGYDPASGYLFLPGQGVALPAVPAEPTADQLAEAVRMIGLPLAGFPWVDQDDRANFIGAMITPLLRLVTPPTYKLIGIGAHQPGSGKTLLADILTILHGGVLRSEMPEDEPEMRKQTTSILSTTSSPVVHIDNVTGVLRSSTLAGLLTAGQATSDRVLGTSQMVTTVNDRVWVVTGNNLSLGGDLVRRTIIITIDPNMANPETRSFDIPDLKGWVREHRNDLLWALLVLVRAWVSAGRPLARRAQSDSFARWEATVAGILTVAGIPGRFDAESGRKAAVGGDDDGLAQLLDTLWGRFADRAWSVAEALEPDEGDFVAQSREWLPTAVLDKLARSEPGGRKSLGRWLLNRLGRWVTTEDGSGLVLRAAGKSRTGVAEWRVEKR